MTTATRLQGRPGDCAADSFANFSDGIANLPMSEYLQELWAVKPPDHLDAAQTGKFHELAAIWRLRLYEKITRELAVLNGLRVNHWTYSVSQVARISHCRTGEDYLACGNWPVRWDIETDPDNYAFDHLTGLKTARGQAAALVSHTYKTDINIEQLRAEILPHDLTVTVPKSGADGSWYYPGLALPLVFHNPNVPFSFPDWIESISLK